MCNSLQSYTSVLDLNAVDLHQRSGQYHQYLLIQTEIRKKTNHLDKKYLKDRQHNDQKEKWQNDKNRSTKHSHKAKDRVTRTTLKPGVKSGAPEWWAVPAPLVAPVVLIL